MTIYLGTTQIQGIKIGTQDVSKICLGSTEVWSNTHSGPALYTEDNGTTLVIGTNYSIPTEIHNSDGATESTTTKLSTPLKLNNLTQSSYGDDYYYSPSLSESIFHTSMTPTTITKDYNYLDDLYKNRTQTSAYPTCSHTIQARSDNNFSQTAYSTIKLTDVPSGYENAKLSVNATTRCSKSSTDEARLNCYLRILGTDGTTVLAESSLLDKSVSGSTTYTYISFPNTQEIPIPTNGFKLHIEARVMNGAKNKPIFNEGRLNFRLTKYLYDTPLYCNIRRTIYNMGETVDDRLEININTNDTFSQYMISLSEQGIATITDKQ